MTEKMTSAAEENKDDIFTITNFESRTNFSQKGEVQNEYNPFENRPPQHLSSTAGTLAHMILSLIGTGTLAMPVAFKNAGILVGTIGTIAAGAICNHCVNMLVDTSQKLCRISKTPTLGYAETAGKACEYGPPKLRRYANFAKQFVDTALICTYFGTCCIYIVFVAGSIENVVEYKLQLGWDIRIYIALVTIPLIFTGQIRQLKYLIPFSTIASSFIVTTFAIILYYMFKEPLEFSDKPLSSDIQQLPLFFSIVVFAMEITGAAMPIMNSMKKPQHFLGCPGVLNIVMAIVITIYTMIGFFGYVRYGDSVQDSITLNLAQGETLADVAKILMALAILCTYSFMINIPAGILWRKFNARISTGCPIIAQSIWRFLLVILTAIIAAGVPSLAPFIGLVGAIFYAVLGFVLPPVIDSIFRWPKQLGIFNWMLFKNILIGLFGTFALITGSVISISDIIKLYQ